MSSAKTLACALCILLVSFARCAWSADIGAIVMHGKWGSPQRIVTELASGLERAGFAVTVPEMPWSGERLYDRSVDAAIAETDAHIATLQKGGVKHVFLIGHSLGAAFALHYATRSAVSGVVAIAPGHRAESPAFARLFEEDLTKARELVGSGKGAELVAFNDPNTGRRRKLIRAPAAVFLSYFDPTGPMNMTRNVSNIKPEVPVLWLVPTREERPARDALARLSKSLPPNPGTRYAEPESDHLNAPGASTRLIVEWVTAITQGVTRGADARKMGP